VISAEKFLELAESLIRLERNRPRQATLRRAISTAYYAVFHLLVTDYTALFSSDPNVQSMLGRTIKHNDIDASARDFNRVSFKLPSSLDNSGITNSNELIAVANAFIELQEHRHDADYDLALSYTRDEAQLIVNIARTSFTNWRIARTTPAATIFLACFQLKKSWDVKR